MVRNGGVAVQISGIEEKVKIDMELFEWDKIYINPLYGKCDPERDFPKLLAHYARGELQIDEEELKKLVSQGELRGFRDGLSMKFKKDDVLNLKQGRETEPTIILTDSDQEMGIAESSDELILDESTSDTVLNIGDIMSPEKQAEEIVFSDSTEEFSISPHDSDPEAAIPTVEVPSVGEELGISGETDSDAQLVASKSAPELMATTEASSIRDSGDDLRNATPKKQAVSAKSTGPSGGRDAAGRNHSPSSAR